MNNIIDADDTRNMGLKLTSKVSTPIGSLKDYITQDNKVATAVNKEKVLAPNFLYKRRFN
jgi:hypothetical protein